MADILEFKRRTVADIAEIDGLAKKHNDLIDHAGNLYLAVAGQAVDLRKAGLIPNAELVEKATYHLGQAAIALRSMPARGN